MHVNRRTFLAGTAGLLAFGGAGPGFAQPTRNIKVGHTAAVDYAPAWVAIDKGYFANRNLNVAVEIARLPPELHDTAAVSDEAYAELERYFTPEQILELVVTAGWYHTISFVIGAARISLEPWAARFPA